MLKCLGYDVLKSYLLTLQTCQNREKNCHYSLERNNFGFFET